MTVTPNPILAVPSGDRTYPWRASWTVTIADTVGVVGDVNRVVTTARNNFGFTFTVSDLNPVTILPQTGGTTNHIPARGSLVFGDGMIYVADGNGGQQLTITIAAEVIDQFGNRVTASTDVRITAEGKVIALP